MIINVSVMVRGNQIIAEPNYFAVPWRRTAEIVWTIRKSPGWQFRSATSGIEFHAAAQAKRYFVGRIISHENSRISMIDLNNHAGPVVRKARTIPAAKWFKYTINLARVDSKGRFLKGKGNKLSLDPTIENQGC